jgi:chromosomal replication initiation ATPase DnaA
MPSSRQQLALPFPYVASYDPRDFLPAASNQDALVWLDRATDWPERRLALWGPPGCGKSHLLATWVARAGAVRLAGQELLELDVMPESGAVAVDDADTVASETTLLHLLNTARDRGLVVLLSSRTPPARWPVRLPDLASRLRGMTAIEIGPPDDELLRALLMRMLADRQLAVPRPVQEWLLLRLPRSAAALRQAVAHLDHSSLASGRAITQALAAELLAGKDGLVLVPDESSVANGTPCARPSGLR